LSAKALNSFGLFILARAKLGTAERPIFGLSAQLSLYRIVLYVSNRIDEVLLISSAMPASF
jgi:hypothetical protein